MSTSALTLEAAKVARRFPAAALMGSEASLDSQMMNLVGSCGALMGESAINVSFTQGCADHVYWETSTTNPTPILACLANVLAPPVSPVPKRFPAGMGQFDTDVVYQRLAVKLRAAVRGR